MFYTWKSTLYVAAFVLALALGWRLYDRVYQSGRRDCAAEQAQLADAAARRAREQAQAQAARDLAAAKAQAAARLAQLTRRHALEADIARRPVPPDCGLDGTSLGLLNNTIRAGNAGAPSRSGELPDRVPAGAGADGREPADAAPVGG